MTDKEVINDFKNIVEESRTEDRTEYYIKLRNTLDVLEKHQNRIKELEKIEEAHRELNGELRKELQLKDKMIDLMANCIATNDSDLCQYLDITTEKRIKEYFTKKASEDSA